MTTSLTDQQLAAMRAREAAAFDGPWFTDSLDERDGSTSIGVATESDTWIIELGDLDPADAEFIAHARSDVPALLAEVVALRSAARAAAVILRSVADRVEMRQQANPAALRGNADELDRIAGKASPAGPTATQHDPGDRVVAYRNSDRPGVLLCREHGEGWMGLTPLTSEDLPDGGTCTWGEPDETCGRDVLIVEGGDAR